MKILHGMINIAGQGTFSVKGLRENGYDARLVVWRYNKFGYKNDLCLNIGYNKFLYPVYIIKILFYALYASIKYDTFHFHFGYSLLPYNIDLPILKLFHKKIFMEYHGSDVRFVLSTDTGNSFYNYMIPEINKKKLSKSIKKVYKYADGIILHDSELEKYLIGYNKNFIYVPLRADIGNIEPVYPNPQKKRPIVVHAPTNKEVKGSEYVIKAVEHLKEKYDFEFVLVQNKTQKEAFEIYKKADIIIDQLLQGSYGVFAIESMALGKPVIGYISDDMKSKFPKELPIVNASIYTIEKCLESLIIDSSLRYELGKSGRIYVENYHDYKNIGKLLPEIYTSKYRGKRQLDSFISIRQLKERNHK